MSAQTPLAGPQYEQEALQHFWLGWHVVKPQGTLVGASFGESPGASVDESEEPSFAPVSRLPASGRHWTLIPVQWPLQH
jgi:hypothetical protein